MKNLFFVQHKTAEGWEPLGVMTMLDAFRWAWNNGHHVLDFSPVGSPKHAECGPS